MSTEGSGALPGAIPSEMVPKQGILHWRSLIFLADVAQVRGEVLKLGTPQ